MNKIGRTVAIVGVVILLFAVIVLNSSTRQSASDQAWNLAATTGNPDAKNFYVMYTDLMCPYCDIYSRAVMENQDKFDAYLAENDILFEVRMTDYLYEAYGAKSQYSRDAAEAVYCATREDKFWEYYHGALTALDEDYHSKGIGDSKTSPAIKNLPEDYWIEIGHEAGLGESFDNCVANHETADELDKNTERALQAVGSGGFPYFKFNRFENAGIGDTDWEQLEKHLSYGLRK